VAENVHEHLDPTSEIALETVKKKAFKGVVVLTGRTFILSTISLLATGLLAVYLDPSEFGVFWIVSAIVNFLAYFSDIGLAAALIQKKDKVTDKDLKTTFTIQQGLVLTLLVILFFATPLFSKYYSLSKEGELLLYALGISFFMSSLKTIPSTLLERELDFNKLILPQILENLVFNTLAVVLAWKGFGVMSFTIAVLARGLIGLIAIYILKPWMPGIAFSKKSIKKLLSFGVPYQANTLLATLKDDGMTIFLGGVIGTSGIGILGWAQKWGQAPLRFFMDHVIKATFPAFSRMQDAKSQLERSVTRSIFFICFLVYPSVVGLLILSPLLVQIIPKYGKWSPALIPLALIAINTVFAAVTTQLTNLLNSIGKIKITFKLMIMWTVLTWLIVPILAVRYSVIGAAAGYSILGATSVIAIYIARKHVAFSLIESAIKPGLAALIMAAVLLVLRGILPVSLYTIWFLIAVGIVSYLISVYVIVGSKIVTDVKRGLNTIVNR
jgi:O-antigen/teichoic acid export membrane protein